LRGHAARRENQRRLLVLLGLALAVGGFLVGLAERHGFFDLRVYHGAINYWVWDGGSLYDYVVPKSHYGFTYPPFAALMMLPMALVPWHLAIAISAVACALVAVLVVFWLVDPVARGQGWPRWFAVGVAVLFAAAFEPLRETFLFGQVNMLLVGLVAADVLLLARGSRFAGVGIGLATAIKLTPGIFVIYLLVTQRWRAAWVAMATAAAMTVLAAAIAPDASRVFWTDAVWNTDRIGVLSFVSNQSLNGALARWSPAGPNPLLWLALAAAVSVVWLVRVRRAVAAGDELLGFALTGILGCLISPITWIHHLVWVGPAILLLLDRAMAAPDRRRRNALLALMIFSYALLSSRFVWNFHDEFDDVIGWLQSNAYVWVSLVLLLAVPVRAVRAGSAAPLTPAEGAPTAVAGTATPVGAHA
jgi:alpha-1,2-mannosyltransferase